MGNCICYDGDFDKCPFVDVVQTVEIKGFKDEKPECVKRCEYQLYVGSPFIISNFTREEVDQIMKENTLCTYI